MKPNPPDRRDPHAGRRREGDAGTPATETGAPEAGAPATDGGAPATEARRAGAGRQLLSGAGWNAAAQLTPVAVNLALTPYVIHGLGLTQYGLYALAATITVFLAAVNGGIGPAAPRFFAVLAGQDDRRAATRLLTTLLLVVAAGGTLLGVLVWFGSPLLAAALHMPVRYRPASVFLLRTFGLLVFIGLGAQLFIAVLQAHQRFALTTRASMISYLAWAAGLFLTVRFGWGLRGVALALVAERAVDVALTLPFAFRYLELRSVGLVSRAEVRRFFAFSAKSQLSGLNALITMESDAIVIGAFLSVRAVGLYNAGANVASQLLAVTFAAVPPLSNHLATVFGRSGEEATIDETARLQRFWVIGMSGWWAAALGSTYFGVSAWLGPHFQVAAVVCVVLVGGYGVSVLAAVIPAHANAVGRPGVEARYGAVALALNLVLTVPLVFVGVLGVVGATTAGLVVGTFYLVRLARRQLSPRVAALRADVPVVRAVACAGVTVGLELLVAPYAPQGPLGLLLCGVPALVALGAYGFSFLGPRRALAAARTLARGGGLADLLVGEA